MLADWRAFDRFELPSLFPFLLIPPLALRPSIAAALWVNFASTLLLIWSVHQLCRQLEEQGQITITRGDINDEYV